MQQYSLLARLVSKQKPRGVAAGLLSLLDIGYWKLVI